MNAGHLSERRFNARRWLTSATLGETKNVLAKRDRNLNPVQTTADVAVIYNSGVGAYVAFGKVPHVFSWIGEFFRRECLAVDCKCFAASGAEREDVNQQNLK